MATTGRTTTRPPAGPASRTRAEIWADFHRNVPAVQHGVAGLWQAVAHGIPRQSFADYVRCHGWQRLSSGVVAEPSSRHSYERSCWALLVALRLRGRLTGETALWMHGVYGQETPRPSVIDVLVAGPHHPRPRPGVHLIRTDTLDAEARDRRRGFEVTPAPRAWADFARRATSDQLVAAVAGLDRLRLATPEDLASYLQRRGQFPGRTSAWAALQRAQGQLTHSSREHTARRLLHEADLALAPWPRPLAVLLDGVAIAEVDVPWPQVRYGVEIDGPHHQLPAQQQADRSRDRCLTSLGWMIDRFSVDEIEQSPGQFVREVRAGLAAATQRRPEPWMV